MNETETTIELPPQNMQVPVTTEMLAKMFEPHFQVVAYGLALNYQGVPQQFLWEAIAGAMGGVLSLATKSPDIAGCLQARGHMGDVVNKAIRKRHPALEAVSTHNAKMNGQAGHSVPS